MDNNTVLLLIIAAYLVMQMCKSQKRESFANDPAEVAKCKQCVDDSITCTAYRDFLDSHNVQDSKTNLDNQIDQKKSEINSLNDEVDSLNNEVESLNKQVKSLNDQVDEKEKELKNLRNSRNELDTPGGVFKDQTQAMFDKADVVCSKECANVEGSAKATSFDDPNRTGLEDILFSLEDNCP